MSALPAIRYDRPARDVRPTPWGRDWRMKWLRSVGSVHQHWKTQQLVAFYSDDRDPSIRRSLEAELEGRPTGVAEVLAACREATDRHNRMIDSATQRHGAVAGEKA